MLHLTRAAAHALVAIVFMIVLVPLAVPFDQVRGSGTDKAALAVLKKPASADVHHADEAANTSIDHSEKSRQDAAGLPAAEGGAGMEQEENLSLSETPETLLVAIGDSLTQGVGDRPDGGGYVERVRVSLEASGLERVAAVNLGKNGNRSDQLLSRMQKKEVRAELSRAQTIMLSIGGNDLMKVVKDHITNLKIEPFREGLEHYEQRLRDIVQDIRTLNPDANIYALGLFNPFSAWFADITEMTQILAEWNRAVRLVCMSEEGMTYVPIDDIFDAGGPDLLGDDLFHPNEEGYRLIAERVLDVMSARADEVQFNEDNE